MRPLLMALISMVSVIQMFGQASMEISVISMEDNRPLSEIQIKISNEDIGFLEIYTTNEQGKIRVNGLSTSGKYHLEFDGNDDYVAFFQDGLALRSNQKASYIIALLPKSVRELDELTVTSGGLAQINTINAEVSSELEQADIQVLPVEGRDITRALYRLPNVTQATGFFPEAPNVSINGANSLFTNYLIDGMENNENFLGGMKFNIPVGFTRNITVLTNNYSAEYGWTGNGVFNVTTKSGTNDVTGEVFYLTRPGPVIDSSSPFAQRDLSGNQVKDGFMRNQFGFGMGLPLKKDKTFLYLNAEQTFDRKDNLLSVPDLGVNETVRGSNRFTYFSARVDQRWNSKVRTSFRVNSGLVDIERQGGGLEGGVTFPSAGNSQKRNSLLLSVQNTYPLGGGVAETNLQYGRFRWDYATPVNPNDPQVTLRNPDGVVIGVLGHPGYVFDALENTLNFQHKQNWILKNHSFKAGVEYIRSDHQLFGGGNPNGNYDVQLNQQQLDDLNALNKGAALGINDIPGDVTVLQYNIELRPQSFGKIQNRYSVYFEDLWSVNSNLNLTLGLRYDYDNLSSVGGSDGDFNNLAPRINANYKLNDRMSVRAGYGMFYEKILYAVYSDALQQNTTGSDYKKQIQALIDAGQLPQSTNIDEITFDGNLSATFDGSGITYLDGPASDEVMSERNAIFSGERRVINPEGYENPMTHQFNLGYQFQVNKNVLFYADLIHTRSYNLFRLRNLNAPEAYNVIYDSDFDGSDIRTPDEADATRPVPISNGSAVINGETLTGVARNVVMSESEGESRYWALNLNLVKNKDEGYFAYRISYTLSRLENNTEDINFRAMDANNFEGEWGASINDRRHVLSALLYYYPIKNLSVSLASLIQSGQPVNRIPQGFGTTDLNGDGSGFGDAYVGNSDRFPGESRNNDRLPWSNTFDLGVKYSFNLFDNSLELSADVFNLFNTINYSGYSNNATQSNQIQAGPKSSNTFVYRNAAPPRQFQFGVRYLF
ncbi:TonB-dependent receptor plug domain-containing protein [Marinigracilibium pacificum]|uniref:TonB-dependent receptor n=1 Tax=Marinigracilibium pacificum TaxID=2729599 RepID=A0A848J2V5_9BACT|nr:TonB-dependent receptor [Marinigracilibium pacificum]NMM48870.1 TonB-dependent receptor [Marinigracilibium pacificum]